MEIKINYTVVGAFVLILFSFIVFSIIWLSSGFSVNHYKIYKVYMKESVAGLNVDSAVEFNGVNIGTVKSIEIDTHDPHLVVLLLNVNTGTPISKGTRATLNTKGLTGVAYIALVDQGNDVTPLNALPGEDYPIIETAPSFFWRLDTGMHKLSENFAKITTALQGILDEENLRSIKEILIEVRQVTRTLAANTEEMTIILHNTAKASEQFSPLLHSSQGIMGVLNAQILPAANQAMTNLEVITHNLSQLSIELKENPAMIIRGKTQPPLGPGEK
jgi:phospholipid/cholesterol/gamma-HCH transport system substrate-binding protein